MKYVLSAFSFLLFAFSFSAHAQMDFSDIPYLSIANTPNTGSPNVTSGLQAWYKFDVGSGTSAADSSGNNYTGTLTGSPLLPLWTNVSQVGPFALKFDGTNAYVDLASQVNTILSASANNFSITAWVRWDGLPGAVAGEDNILASSTGSSDRFYVQLKTATSILSAAVYNGSFIAAGADSAITSNVWIHVCAVYSNATTMYLYTNAVVNSGSTSPATDGGSATRIGKGLFQGGFSGYIDDVRVYNRVLTGAEITTIYNYR